MSAKLVMVSIEPSGRTNLSDGSIWRIVPNQVIVAVAWRGNQVGVQRDDSAVWNYRLTNLETRASVHMLPEDDRQPRLVRGDYLRVIKHA
jgi:hypothetical protein